MKTLAELLASGTLAEIIAQQTEHTKRIDFLVAESAKRETKAFTTEEATEIRRLDDEVEQLQVKRVELETMEGIKARNTKRVTDLNTPANRPQFSGGNGGDDSTKNVKVEFPFAGSLKNFKVGMPGMATHAEAEMKAFRFGKFMQVVMAAPGGVVQQSSALEWCKSNGIEIKVQSEGVPSEGGVLVPTEFERMLIDLREQYGAFRRNVKTVPMGSETKLIPRRTGGLTSYFIGEGSAITQSSKTWDNIQLIAKKLATLVVYSTEVNEDAIISMADDLAGEIAYANALKEDQVGFNGTGISTDGGITGVRTKLAGLSGTIANIAGIRVQATVSTGTFASAAMADFTATIGKLPLYADTPNAKFYVHKTFFSNVMEGLMAAAGGNTIRDIAQGNRGTTFLGYPVEFSQVLPHIWVADTIFALFGDLTLAAKMGDRRQTTLFTDPYSLSANDQVQIRGTERFDIVVHDVGNASATAADRVPGPVVGFASAAS